MAVLEIEALVEQTMGLKVTAANKATMARAVKRRMSALAVADINSYIRILRSSHHELEELVEEVVIPETWFFRDQEPFNAMIHYLAGHWSPKHRNDTLKVLSVPCSTGEEPYSLAMSLLSSGWPAEKFTIHGIDISSRSIARAKAGVYSKNSFRGTSLDFIARYFQKTGQYYILDKSVRDLVHFHPGNILNKVFMEALGQFDVIFFRNVLIYFNGLSRLQAIATLETIMTADGILFVGHAETNLFSAAPFVPAPYRRSFAFHKKPKEQLTVATQNRVAEKPIPAKPKISQVRQTSAAKKKTAQKQADLEHARELADRGELVKATAICHEYLEQQGPTAQAFFLLGLLLDAADDPVRAEDFFRKALYLDPDHEESLVFLSLLVARKGDGAEAKKLRQRLERLQGKSDSPPLAI